MDIGGRERGCSFIKTSAQCISVWGWNVHLWRIFRQQSFWSFLFPFRYSFFPLSPFLATPPCQLPSLSCITDWSLSFLLITPYFREWGMGTNFKGRISWTSRSFISGVGKHNGHPWRKIQIWSSFWCSSLVLWFVLSFFILSGRGKRANSTHFREERMDSTQTRWEGQTLSKVQPFHCCSGWQCGVAVWRTRIVGKLWKFQTQESGWYVAFCFGYQPIYLFLIITTSNHIQSQLRWQILGPRASFKYKREERQEAQAWTDQFLRRYTGGGCIALVEVYVGEESCQSFLHIQTHP